MKRALLALVLASIACGVDATPTATPGASVPTSTDEFFAFVLSAEDAELTFDPAEILTGDEAHDAAVAAGVISEDEDLPNDYFISNPEEDSQTVVLSAAGSFVLLGFDAGGAIQEVTVDRDELITALQDGEGYYGIVVGETPMTLVVSGGEIIAASQVYFP
ncbi:MAG TPA: hypothetical protein VIA81_07570 [Acidimicrobiia bacterium]|jgi:hypothetical protein